MAKHSGYHIPGKLIRLGNGVKEFRNRHFQELGLTSAQADALFFILRPHQTKAPSATEVKSVLNLSQSTVAGILARLESKGFIERREDEADSRRMLLYPTEKSLSLREGIGKDAARTEALLLTGMTEQEKESFSRLLSIALCNIGFCVNGSCENKEQEQKMQ